MTNKEFKKLKDNLWLAANKLRADSDLKSNDYSPPVLGIIFLKFADIKYSQYEKEIKFMSFSLVNLVFANTQKSRP